MKKTILLILLATFSLASFSQTVQQYVTAKKKFTLAGDAFYNTTQVTVADSLLATKQYVINSMGAGNGWDSLLWTPSTGMLSWYKLGSKVSEENLDGRYVRRQDSTQVSQYNYVTQKQLTTAINASNAQTVFTIKLPSSTTVAGRCSGAVGGGVDYPLYWTIEAGTSAADLKITHLTGRRVAYVSVWAVDGVSERQLFGNAAYSGVYAETNQILRIESLATVNKAIVIEIVFAQ